MQSVENFVGETVSTYLYFYIDFVDGEPVPVTPQHKTLILNLVKV